VSPHTAFLTSADLAVQFYNAGWIDQAALTKVVNEVAYDSGNKNGLTGTVAPSFMECSQFRSWPTLKATAGAADLQAYETIKSNMAAICKQ
jgi:hypothetical protein